MGLRRLREAGLIGRVRIRRPDDFSHLPDIGIRRTAAAAEDVDKTLRNVGANLQRHFFRRLVVLPEVVR